MKNRAKCKICKDIIESFHRDDLIFCKCGEIYVDGGLQLICGANEWENFLRIDDEGNEIIVKVKEKAISEEKPTQEKEKPTRKELLGMLDTMLQKIEEMPQKSMSTYVNHYDLYSFMLLVSSVLKEGCDCKPSS